MAQGITWQERGHVCMSAYAVLSLSPSSLQCHRDPIPECHSQIKVLCISYHWRGLWVLHLSMSLGKQIIFTPLCSFLKRTVLVIDGFVFAHLFWEAPAHHTGMTGSSARKSPRGRTCESKFNAYEVLLENISASVTGKCYWRKQWYLLRYLNFTSDRSIYRNFFSFCFLVFLRCV